MAKAAFTGQGRGQLHWTLTRRPRVVPGAEGSPSSHALAQQAHHQFPHLLCVTESLQALLLLPLFST